MLSKSRIIILRTIKHSDTGIVVQAYSDTDGRTALYFHGGGKNTKETSYLQQLNILDVIAYDSGKGGMKTIKEMTPSFLFTSIRTDIRKIAISMFVTELLAKTVMETEANPQLYSFLETSVLLLENTTSGTENFHLHFLAHYCKVLGYMPIDNYSYSLPYFDFVQACYSGIYDKNCCFNAFESTLLHTILVTPVDKIEEIKCTGTERFEFISKLLDYLSYHMDGKLDMKSLPVLHEIFA